MSKDSFATDTDLESIAGKILNPNLKNLPLDALSIWKFFFKKMEYNDFTLTLGMKFVPYFFLVTII